MVTAFLSIVSIGLAIWLLWEISENSVLRFNNKILREMINDLNKELKNK